MAQTWRGWQLGLAGVITTGGAIIASGEWILAQQIRPDATLGTESSAITRNVLINNLSSDRVEGGARRGANLFHSFQEFNIENGRGAYFSNPAGVETILSRVTGKNRSDLQGTLGVLGDANLFLINPNGIIFGPNASLDLNGSFLASTASSLNFADGTEFSASNPQAPSLLAINVPTGLQYGTNQPRKITSTQNTLSIDQGQSLILVGGEIVLDNSSLDSFFQGGRIELGGVAGVGTIGLGTSDNQLSLSFPDDVTRANVSLTNGSTLNVAAINAGSIKINAQNLKILRGSALQAGSLFGAAGDQAGDIEINATGAVTLAEGSGIFNAAYFGVGNGGDISITAKSLSITDGTEVLAIAYDRGDTGNINVTVSDSVELTGFLSRLSTQVYDQAQGDGKNVRIETGRLIVRDGAQVGASTFGIGDAGNLTVIASDLVEVTGRSPAGSIVESDPTSDGSVPSGLFTQVDRIAGGNAGDIRIETGRLVISGGAAVSARSFGTVGQADAGNVTVIAPDSVEIIGTYEYELPIGPQIRRSGLFTQVGRRLEEDVIRGNAGKVKVETGRLIIRDGATLNSRNSGQGTAGDIDVTARSVKLNGSGSSISAQHIGAGDAGNLTINAGQVAVQDGTAITTATVSGRSGDITLQDLDFLQVNNGSISASTQTGQAGSLSVDAIDTVKLSQEGSLSVEATSGGVAGSLSINARQLFVEDGAEVTVSSPLGKAGDLTTIAGSILLNRGKLTAVTGAGDGGNTTLGVPDLLLMRDNSLISAEALSAANGGNIDIDTNLLVAIPSENSDIVANAIRGSGGKVDITTQGIFGIEPRQQQTSESDITTSSELGIDGVVEINTPDVDPSQGVVALPEEVVDASGLVAQRCPAGGGIVASKASKFVVTGRGGLPPNPSQPSSSEAVLANWITLDPKTEETGSSPARAINPMTEAAPTMEAQGWVKDAKGQVVLTAQASRVTPRSFRLAPASCPVDKTNSETAIP